MPQKTMTKNITNRSDPYTYIKITHQKCSQGLHIPVFWECVLELHQEGMYMAAPYPGKEEPQLTFHKSEHRSPQKRSINR